MATVGDRDLSVGKILTCTLKNHYLLFLIKNFESLLGIIKDISEKISEKILLWAIFRKSVNDDLASYNFQSLSFYCFLYSQKTTKTCKKGALCICSYVQCVWCQHNQFRALGECRSACMFSCKVLQILCFWLCTTMM